MERERRGKNKREWDIGWKEGKRSEGTGNRKRMTEEENRETGKEEKWKQ